MVVERPITFVKRLTVQQQHRYLYLLIEHEKHRRKDGDKLDYKPKWWPDNIKYYHPMYKYNTCSIRKWKIILSKLFKRYFILNDDHILFCNLARYVINSDGFFLDKNTPITQPLDNDKRITINENCLKLLLREPKIQLYDVVKYGGNNLIKRESITQEAFLLNFNLIKKRNDEPFTYRQNFRYSKAKANVLLKTLRRKCSRKLIVKSENCLQSDLKCVNKTENRELRVLLENVPNIKMNEMNKSPRVNEENILKLINKKNKSMQPRNCRAELRSLINTLPNIQFRGISEIINLPRRSKTFKENSDLNTINSETELKESKTSEEIQNHFHETSKFSKEIQQLLKSRPCIKIKKISATNIQKDANSKLANNENKTDHYNSNRALSQLHSLPNIQFKTNESDLKLINSETVRNEMQNLSTFCTENRDINPFPPSDKNPLSTITNGTESIKNLKKGSKQLQELLKSSKIDFKHPERVKRAYAESKTRLTRKRIKELLEKCESDYSVVKTRKILDKSDSNGIESVKNLNCSDISVNLPYIHLDRNHEIDCLVAKWVKHNKLTT